ncbi:GumC family protein [Rhizobium oryzicola]|uniref:GumC family protein n=1 Tax=Rhizobium oryzicola TaxID=1232668 RepID=A0ABT8T3U4_9HYPH|nr:GumC family protein [Rhizobium oryzicola]MDO1585250.1 GumC family protein [Rhizobium oryzicola]
MPAEHTRPQNPVFDMFAGSKTYGIFTAVWHHRLLFTIVLSSVVLLFAVAAFVIPPRYLATSMAIVAEADPGTKISDVWAQKQGDPADLESQIMILRSSRLLKLALSQPGALEASLEDCRNTLGTCNGMDQNSAKLIEETAKHYSMAAVGRSRVLSISYASPSPDIAMTMANALVTAYLDDQRGTESGSREVAAKWLWQEVADLDREIRDKVTKIEAFRRQNGLVQGATAAISSESLTNISQQLAAAEQTKAQAQARLDAVRNLRNDPNGAPTSQTLENRTVADLKQQIATVANQLAASSTILGARHPQRQMLEASLALLQKQLDTELARVTASAQKDYQAASSLVDTLRQQVDKAKNNAADALSSESSIEGMLRDVEAKRQLYTQLYQRASELESERRALVGGARLVSLAEKPTQPYFPKKMPMLAAGFALGVFVAGISCIIRSRLAEHSEQGVTPVRNEAVPASAKSRAARHEHAPLPILGRLPNIPSSSLLDAEDESLSSVLRRGLTSREFRQHAEEMATNILPLTHHRPLLLLPSVARTDFVTFFTQVLAKTLGERGHRTLLIECAPAARSLEELFSFDQLSPEIAKAVMARSQRFNNLSAQAPQLQAMVGADVDDSTLTKIERHGWRALSDWAEAYDVIILYGPSLFDAKARSALRLLGNTEINALVCLEDGIDPEEMAEVEVTLQELGLPAEGAVLLPRIKQDQRSAGTVAHSGRRSA